MSFVNWMSLTLDFKLLKWNICMEFLGELSLNLMFWCTSLLSCKIFPFYRGIDSFPT